MLFLFFLNNLRKFFLKKKKNFKFKKKTRFEKNIVIGLLGNEIVLFQ